MASLAAMGETGVCAIHNKRRNRIAQSPPSLPAPRGENRRGMSGVTLPAAEKGRGFTSPPPSASPSPPAERGNEGVRSVGRLSLAAARPQQVWKPALLLLPFSPCPAGREQAGDEWGNPADRPATHFGSASHLTPISPSNHYQRTLEPQLVMEPNPRHHGSGRVKSNDNVTERRLTARGVRIYYGCAFGKPFRSNALGGEPCPS